MGYPPFAFFPKEYMTAGSRHGNRIKLIGKMSSFGGFKETDTLNATTHQMIGESIYFGHNHPKTQNHLITSYHQVNRAPSVPHTNRSASGCRRRGTRDAPGVAEPGPLSGGA